MKKELSNIKPRGIGVKRALHKIPAVLGVLYFHAMTNAPMVAFAADKKKSGGTTDTTIKYGDESNPYQKDKKSLGAVTLRGDNLDYTL